MSNELIFLVMLLIVFSSILMSFRFLGCLGLFVWIPITVILANIQVLKTVEFLGITATLGNILYAGSFLITDIMSEIYGKKTARTAVLIGFITLIMTTIIMNLAISFTPGSTDIAQPHIEALFSFFPSLTVASLLAFGVSQFHDIWSYDFWRRLRPELRFIWLRNNLSTLVSQLLDSFIFVCAATLFGIFSWSVFAEIFVSTWLIKALVSLLDTPFIWLAAWMNRHKKVREVLP